MKATLCICVFQLSKVFYKKLINVLNPKTILRKYFFILKKKFWDTFQFTQDFRERIGKKTQVSSFLVSVFTWPTPFCHFFLFFQSFLTDNESTKLSGIFEDKRYSATSNFLQICLPKSSEPQIDYYIDDIYSRSPQWMWERSLPDGSPINLMLTMTKQNKCIQHFKTKNSCKSSIQIKWKPDWKNPPHKPTWSTIQKNAHTHTHSFSDIFSLYDHVLWKLMVSWKTDILNARVGL